MLNKKDGIIVIVIVMVALVAIFSFNDYIKKPTLSPSLEEEIAKAKAGTQDNCPPPDLIVCAKFISPADAYCKLLREECAMCGGSGTNPYYGAYTCYKIHSKMTDYLI